MAWGNKGPAVQVTDWQKQPSNPVPTAAQTRNSSGSAQAQTGRRGRCGWGRALGAGLGNHTLRLRVRGVAVAPARVGGRRRGEVTQA